MPYTYSRTVNKTIPKAQTTSLLSKLQEDIMSIDLCVGLEPYREAKHVCFQVLPFTQGEKVNKLQSKLPIQF